MLFDVKQKCYSYIGQQKRRLFVVVVDVVAVEDDDDDDDDDVFVHVNGFYFIFLVKWNSEFIFRQCKTYYKRERSNSSECIRFMADIAQCKAFLTGSGVVNARRLTRAYRRQIEFRFSWTVPCLRRRLDIRATRCLISRDIWIQTYSSFYSVIKIQISC